jgi:exo-1,4-beta-D-glucosaminidase
VLYAYDDGSVTVDNLGATTQGDLSVEANVYALDGTLLSHETNGGITLRSQGVATEVLHPQVPATTKPPTPAQTYFIELVLSQHGQIIDRNVYWRSTQNDVVNWRKTIGNPQATMTQFANFAGLQTLRLAALSITARTHSQPGPNGADIVTDVTIQNTSSTNSVAFFIRADIRRGSPAGVPDSGDNEVLPTFWSDDDITLWPGESETLHASYRAADLQGRSPVVSVFGWNVPNVDVMAP